MILTKENEARILEEIKEISKRACSYREIAEEMGIPLIILKETWLREWFYEERNEIQENLKKNKIKKEMKRLDKLRILSQTACTYKELAEEMEIHTGTVSMFLNKFPDEKNEIKENLKINRKKKREKERLKIKKENAEIIEKVEEISKRVYTLKEIAIEMEMTNLDIWLTNNFPEKKPEIQRRLKENKERRRLESQRNISKEERIKQVQQRKLQKLKRIIEASKKECTYQDLKKETGLSIRWVEKNFPEEKENIRANLEKNRENKKKEKKRQNEQILEKVKDISKNVSSMHELAIKVKIENLYNWLKWNFPEEISEIQTNLKANKDKKKEEKNMKEADWLEKALTLSKRTYSFTGLAAEMKIYSATTLDTFLRKFPETKNKIKENFEINKAQKDKFILEDIELLENKMIFHTRNNSIAEVWHESENKIELLQNESVELNSGDYLLIAQYDELIDEIIIIACQILENSKMVKLKSREVIKCAIMCFQNEKIRNFAKKAQEILN